MEFGFFPRSFTVAPGTVMTSEGEKPVVRIQLQDMGGAVVTVTFGAEDWDQFVKVCADPAAAAARARIAVPRMAPSITTKKH